MSIATTPRAAVQRAWHAIDTYTSPRYTPGAETHGDIMVTGESGEAQLGKHSYVQAGVRCLEDSLTIVGLSPKSLVLLPAGVAATAAARYAHDHVEWKHAPKAAGMLAGAVAGTACMAAGVALLGSGALVPMLLTGAFVGALQGLRGDPQAKIRDATVGGPALMQGGANIAGMLGVGIGPLGVSTVASSIGAGIGATKYKKPWVQALIGAATGAALGAAMGGLGLGAGVLATAILGGIGGAVGPVFGQRFNQGVRNLAQDVGKGLRKLFPRMSPEKAEVVGTIPAVWAGEMIDSVGLTGTLVTTVAAVALPTPIVFSLPEVIENLHLLFTRKHNVDEERR